MRLNNLTARFKPFLGRVRAFLWADLPPWKMGLSAAIGAGIALTPTIGLQTILVTAIVSLVRGNRGLALITSGIANPWTIPFIYYVNFRVGAALLGRPPWAGLPEQFSPGALSGAFLPVLVGSLIVGTVGGILVGTGVTVLCRLRGRPVERHQVPV